MVSGKKVTAMVVTELMFLSPPEKKTETVFSVLHLTDAAASLTSVKLVTERNTHTPATAQTFGSSNRIIPETGDEFAAITSIQTIFERGLR